MSEPTIKQPTKKAFHFPKAADNARARKKKVAADTPAVENAAAIEKVGIVESAAATESAASVKAPKKAAQKATKKVAGKAPRKAVGKTPKKAPEKAAGKVPEKAVEKAPAVKKSAKPQSGPTIRTKPAKPSPAVKAKRPKKDKVVRDSFTMPKSDYEKIAALKLKCQEAGVAVKKSEILRAGLLMLEAASPTRLLAAMSAVEPVKTGRPAKS